MAQQTKKPSSSGAPAAAAASAQGTAIGLRSEIRVAAAQSAAQTVFDAFVERSRSVSGSVLDRTEVLLDLAFVYLNLVKDWQRALDLAADAVSFAQQEQDQPALRRAWTTQGLVLEETGNPSGALDCGVKALELAESLGQSAIVLCGLWCNIGNALSHLGQYDAAQQAWSRSVRIGADLEQTRGSRAKAHSNAAYNYFLTLDLNQCREHLDKAINLLGPPKTPEASAHRVIMESLLARCHLRAKEIESARTHARYAREITGQSASPLAEIAALIAEGLTDVYDGLVDIGMTRLSTAVETGRALSTTAARTALGAAIEGANVAERYEEIVLRQRELNALMLQSQQASALLHHRDHMTRLGLRRQDDTALQSSISSGLRENKLRSELFEARTEVLERLAVAADIRDGTTGEHSYRMGRLAALLGEAYGLDEDTCRMLELAARLHDIGKIGLGDSILLKPGSLTVSEIAIMRNHTHIGAELLSQSQIEDEQMAAQIALCHHEAWDGTGYPERLVGPAIPLVARIASITDVFDALSHPRPYKEAWSLDIVLEHMQALSGRQFDPHLIGLFVPMIRRLVALHGDLDQFLLREMTKRGALSANKRLLSMIGRFTALSPQDPAI